jgi:hypothetical protein
MSKEMLPEKLSSDQGLGPGSLPTIKETNKGKRERLIVIFVMAVGVGIVVLTSILLLPYLNPLVGSIFGSKSSSTTDGSSLMLEQPTAPLAPSFKAIDGEGSEVNISNGLARSEQISISGYADSGYSIELQCWIDTLPVYCDGSPITIVGLPDGNHELRIVEARGTGTEVSVFSWTTSSG